MLSNQNLIGHSVMGLEFSRIGKGWCNCRT